MRRLILGTLLALSVPTLTQAAPICVPATLQDYIDLGSGGCMVGDAVFSGFAASVIIPSATPILPDDVIVSPLLGSASLGLMFSLASFVGAGEVEDLLIRYQLRGMSFVTNTLSMSESSVTPEGANIAVEDKCGGQMFDGSLPDPAKCKGTSIGPLIVFDLGIIAELTDTSPAFAPTSFFDVFTEIVVDGGPDGSASLGTVTNEFGFAPTQVVPEPASLVLLGSGLVAVLRRRRRR